MITKSPLPWKRAFAGAAAAALLWTFPAQAEKDDLPAADQKALAGYHLTIEKLDRFDATNKKIAEAMETDPALAKETAGGALNSGTTIDDALAQFDAKAPHLTAIIKASGMTDRDYVMMIFSLMFAASGQMSKQYAPDKPLPAYIPADNVTFAEKNQARFHETMASLERLSAKKKKKRSTEDETTTED